MYAADLLSKLLISFVLLGQFLAYLCDLVGQFVAYFRDLRAQLMAYLLYPVRSARGVPRLRPVRASSWRISSTWFGQLVAYLRDSCGQCLT